MKDFDIQVGDRVTFHYIGDDEVNIWLISYKDEADDFISDNDRKILKIERIGENGWYTVYEKKDLLTDEEREFLKDIIKHYDDISQIEVDVNEIDFCDNSNYIVCTLNYPKNLKFENIKEDKCYTLKELRIGGRSMREVIFRGKRIDNGEWIYGSLIFDVINNKYYIFSSINCPISKERFEVYMCEVDPKTIGQYTGVLDKNGKKIFEKNIVRFRFKEDRAECPDLIGYIEYQSTFTGFRIMSYKGSFKIDALETVIEVIGNTTDNPELLEEEDE